MAHEWRTHPKLKDQFHPDFPDDLQVIVHDGGPRLTNNRPELIWVRLSSIEGDNLFIGTVLNPPSQLSSIQLGQQIRCLVASGTKHPVLVTTKYLDERKSWEIHPCQKCGFDELFDAPSDLTRAIFPKAPPGAVMEMFTSFCPLCGGVQTLQTKQK